MFGAVTLMFGATGLKVVCADAVLPALSRAVTRMGAPMPACPGVHVHSVAVAGSPVQPAIGV